MYVYLIEICILCNGRKIQYTGWQRLGADSKGDLVNNIFFEFIEKY